MKLVSMTKREKAYYDRLPAGLSHEEKLDYMSKWGVKFELLPPRQRTKFIKQMYSNRQSQFIVRYKGKLVAVPQHDVLGTLHRLGIQVEAECILLKI